MKRWTAAPCSGSDVRMKKSFEALTCSTISLKCTTLRSASSRGGMPSRSATSATGSPCSSVPVRKNDVLAALAHVAREHVGGDRRVRVAEVRLRVHVVDRRGDVEAHGER